MSRDLRRHFLYNLPAPVHWEFCRIMDGLSDLAWTRFASEVLGDQVNVRLAERKERRTDYVMRQWANRNGCVGELLDLLEHQQLLHPRDVILSCAVSLKASPLAPPPVILSHFDPPTKSVAPHAMTTHAIHSTVSHCSHSEVKCYIRFFIFPRLSFQMGPSRCRETTSCVSVMDCMTDLTVLMEGFNTEMEKLSKLRHPNIVDLLGVCQGPSVCLIYSYMENQSLEDKLHSVSFELTWNMRVRIVREASAALQFLHSPPDGHKSVIHGDVKSSNILLDRHLVAKLADFGLARFVSTNSSCHLSSKTTTVGRTSMVRGTLAYLPEEYVRNGQLGTAVDVYSFGVVLLEVLTGRRALEKNRKSGDIYLKDVVQEVQEGLTDSYAAAWREQLDQRLIIGGASDIAGTMQMVALACRCLDKKGKKRPAMTEVFSKLQDINYLVRKNDQLAPHCVPPGSCDFSDNSVEVVTQCLSKLEPLEDTYQQPSGCLTLPPSLSNSRFHSSIPTPPLSAQYSSLPPHPSSLHAPSSFPLLTYYFHAPSSSFDNPCEIDESRGFSQNDLSAGSQFNSKMLSSYNTDQYHNLPETTKSHDRELSDYQSSFQESLRAGVSHRPLRGPEILSPQGGLQSLCPETSDDVRAPKEFRGPEESDELEYLAATNT
ncbi:interleukin-1 receptor-associated kinase 1 isoform X2 [Syngnathoides biaculeatus]|uniref:interleukin-1 receptor-associated kinase 1 isoform X2 n=1 Tax=Syngnathoides biaculeatus TaxID=300417 RepID=UPI002ADE6375|nr:interleukin-1 receptor-associated kinase 1 isoform X2 [Syngnathoides biaculeatus]